MPIILGIWMLIAIGEDKIGSPQICGGKILISAVCGLCLTRTGIAGTIVGVFYHE